MTAPEIRVLDDARELAREGADFLLWLGQQAIAAGGRFDVALCGGSTPRSLYDELVTPLSAKALDWSRVRFFFGDERCVAPEHEESNFRLARDHLFTPLQIPPSNIVRMEGELAPDAASERYEAALRERFGVSAPARPRFDLILLGLGADGHTASLFPGTSALRETDRLVTRGRAPTGVTDRLTFTLPLINNAATVLFLVTGASKAPAVRAALEAPPEGPETLPARLVRPHHGRLLWFLDRPAAAALAITKQQVISHEE